ncbi:dual-action HEIGH metallo-peptidase [Lacibacter cauensis]|uniref:Dual-action HEIGH metallo-peptidase n=1 Tax=Lacibacter cauensis TaxID=510947 RepID=A0A562SVY7_9BACT|nr:M57 family metalloprotease [Lacibacter cauensis]TWI84920.1 dual-action HEIGH metallo-peptidase [Lacibacter cauensis]
MRKLFSILAVASFATLFIVACSKSAKEVPQADIPQDVLNQIAALGFSSDNVVASDGGYVVEGDIFLSPSDLTNKKVTNSLLIAKEEQYRTTNLVTGLPRTITVSISGRNITQLLIDGVNAAVGRYNAENLGLTFQYIGTNGGGDINLSVVNTGQYIASAGFPSGGDPYNTIKYARTYTSGYSLNFVTTVIAHEMGHCIGFRHTDYMNRSYSCGGSAVNEGDGGVGAILIPGTPSTPDAASWMLACLSATTNRPFNTNDKTALNYLY